MWIDEQLDSKISKIHLLKKDIQKLQKYVNFGMRVEKLMEKNAYDNNLI